MPSIDDIKSFILKPALTSSFKVFIYTTESLSNLNDYVALTDKTDFFLTCSEASLPGSSLNTQEITGDYHGVTERHAYRRMYDDRIDFTFYVEANSYAQITYFEEWMNFISGDGEKTSSTLNSMVNPNYHYKVKYPDEYKSTIIVQKFERDYRIEDKNKKIHNIKSLNYAFIGAYPISISSMPLSYGGSDVLKCTVSMTYLRYFEKYCDIEKLFDS
ncbi:MAG: hypothetical protein CBD74_11075 [Saprospirales bacterium TMED214]|nr:MAG: hypothetical protein CBD74_11075 [Saprospirales bacterium TMED214]